MAYNSEKLPKLSALQAFAQQAETTYAKKKELAELKTTVEGIVATGGEANVIEGVKVNGTALTIAEKMVNLLITSGITDGTIAVNGVDVAVKGLAALAYKSEVSEAELSTALKAVIDAKAKQSDIDILTGDGDGSISKMITDAFNDFSTKVTNDGVVNSYKELIDWAAAHGSEATEMAAGITANTTAINNLKTLVGTLPEGAASTTIAGYIAEAIAVLSIGDYAKTVEVTAAISTALGNYYTKADIDGRIASDAEVKEMLDEIYGTTTT